MSRKYLIYFGLLITVIGLSGAKVGALLPQQDHSPVSMPFLKVGLEGWTRNMATDPVLEQLNLRIARNPDDYEACLLKGLLLFQNGALAEAINELRDLTEKAPRFQLAHLVLGDLLIARYGRFEPLMADRLGTEIGDAEKAQIRRLQSEARARLKGYLSLVGNTAVPELLLSLSPDTDYALVVDKGKNRLYVFHNSGGGLPPQLVDHFYIVLGKVPGDKVREGDLKTPSGVYFVTSYLPDEILPPLYGAGAFPVNYPNELDRRLRKTGQGIWLHGTDKSLYSRPPLDSEGCVVLTNEEFNDIVQYVDVGRTPVIISDHVKWISSQQWLKENVEIQAALETWRQRWESSDLEGYLDFYASDFWSRDHNEQSWAAYKKQVFSGKTYQKIEFSDLSLFSYPAGDRQRPMVVANFTQHYRSNNFNGDMRKRLYLVKEGEDWKILYEGHQ